MILASKPKEVCTCGNKYRIYSWITDKWICPDCRKEVDCTQLERKEDCDDCIE